MTRSVDACQVVRLRGLLLLPASSGHHGEAGLDLVNVNHPDRFPVVTATRFEAPLPLSVTGAGFPDATTANGGST